jgi:hypothetical protein
MSEPFPEGITSKQIYAALQQYQDLGVIQYVVPTHPLGEQWVLGQEGKIVKLIGDDQAAAWLAGAAAVARHLAARAGLRL